MLMDKLMWLKMADDLHIELMQSKDEGKDVKAFEADVKQIQAMDKKDPKRENLAMEVYEHISSLPLVSDFRYYEPSELEKIMEARPAEGKLLALDASGISDEELYNKVYGAWLGRCAGCLLGKPVEGWQRQRILGFLRDTDNYPIHQYMSSDVPDELIKKYNIDTSEAVKWINKVTCAPEDDDTNYTVIALKILENRGRNFTPEDVADAWLSDIPLMHVCTAERVAYKNFLNLIMPPESASFMNPYREWIGAQIRADLYGYINPANPAKAAEIAWKDSCISHVKNGIYGAMFVAAMLAGAYVSNDIEEIIRIGLSQIPEKSRLYESIRNVLKWKKEGITWEDAIDRIHVLYEQESPHGWCHTISNALIVCIGLIFGECDFEKSIGIAVAAAFDTDCNGATVGSIVGLMLGAKALPEKWTKPLNDQLKTGVDGYNLVKISDMAAKTVKLIKS